MAQITSHVLDAVNGRSAAGIRVQVNRLSGSGEVVPLVDTECDPEGRFSLEIDRDAEDCRFEMVVYAAEYFAGYEDKDVVDAVVPEVVVRFLLPEGRQHIPVVLSPNACTIWWSSPQ